MMRTSITALLALSFIGCSTSNRDATATATSAHKGAATATATAHETSARPGDSVAYFAGGCFWGVEHYMQQLKGVSIVESGYMGGSVDAPTYAQVSSKRSGHVETVRVRYDAKQVSYKALAQRFFEIHDPTQANGQGPDIGPQYRSFVFYESPEEKTTVEKLMGVLVTRGYSVVTKLQPASRFWPAEKGHQNYYARKGGTPYCHARVDRFGARGPTR